MRPGYEADTNMPTQGILDVTEKIFNDPVHGAISLHPLCVKLVDTPQFQRLRNLKQLGSTYFVYPAAAHNRFEHCLGVCHLAGQLVCALQSRQPDLNISPEDVLCVQLAGLCHDLGHGPFSHLWEDFVTRARPDKNWTHEDASVRMFDYLIEENNLHEYFRMYNLHERDLLFIKELIRGPKIINGATWPYEGRNRSKGFLYEIVANKRSGIDVDKWDYFLRDGHSLGIEVKFDYQRLIKFSRVINVEDEGPQICFRDKEVDSLYHMFYTRRALHKTAYQHRVVKTIDSMLIDAFLYADKQIQYRGSNGRKYYLGDVCDDMSAYTYLSDDVFGTILRAEGDHPDLLSAQQILRNILTRKLYSYIGQTYPTSGSMDKNTLMTLLAFKIPPGSSLTRDQLEIHELRLNYGMGDKNPIEKVRFFSKHNPQVAKVLRKEEVSYMLPQSFQEVVFRLVVKNGDESVLQVAQEMFRETCSELNMKAPSIAMRPTHLTPVKCKSPISHENGSSEMNNSAVRVQSKDLYFSSSP
ncbi:SAM domain and HD [Halocaridina rubra]|uniref:SAM domain and HD n=1 Tax=Halocaridina rubra TaxID=373956 RepID=A0AAN8X896_HALRR